MQKYTVKDVRQFVPKGPWQSKSGGELMALGAIPFTEVAAGFMRWDVGEMAKIPTDISGMRFYAVRNIPQGRNGGQEFHRIREEIVFCTEGSVFWEVEDLDKKTRKFALTPGHGIWIRPGILHSYICQEENSGLFVICNTLFLPDNAATHDTYSSRVFRTLQKSGDLAP